jgi:hypothetical protein
VPERAGVSALLDEPSTCPRDPLFEHDNYFGCVPKDFNQRTGRSKTHHQAKRDDPNAPWGYRYRWNGGCDARP